MRVSKTKTAGRIKLRPALRLFAEQMERVLREHDARKGKDITIVAPGVCLRMLKMEFDQVREAAILWRALRNLCMGLPKSQNKNIRTQVREALERLLDQTTDVANYCAMLWLALSDKR